MDYAPGAFLAFLHNLSPAEEPAVRVPRGHTHLLIAAPREATAAAAPPLPALSVALSQHAAKSRPSRSPPGFPGRGKRRESWAAPAVGRDTQFAWGVPQLLFNSWQGKKEAAAQEGGQGSLGLESQWGGA